MKKEPIPDSLYETMLDSIPERLILERVKTLSVKETFRSNKEKANRDLDILGYQKHFLYLDTDEVIRTHRRCVSVKVDIVRGELMIVVIVESNRGTISVLPITETSVAIRVSR